MTSEVEQIDALSRAVVSTDASRRVGWARAFSAEASKEDLSQQINTLRTERDIMRRAASFMYGFLHAYVQLGDPGHAQEALGKYVQHIGAILDSNIVRAGRFKGDEVVRQVPDWRARKDARFAERRALHKDNERAYETGRRKERELLVKRYGFPNEAALLNYLKAYDK